MSTWKFNWLTAWDETQDAAAVAEWQARCTGATAAHVFFEPSLVNAWTETYRPLRRLEPRFLTVSRGNSSAFLPLVLDRTTWKDACMRVLQPVGHNEFDYHDTIMSWEPGATSAAKGTLSTEFWTALLDELRKRGDDFDLCLIPRIRAQTAPPAANPVDVAPFIDLSRHPSFEAFMASRSGNLRQGLKRKQRHLADLGAVQFKVYAPEQATHALDSLSEFRKNHEIRWPRAYRAPGLFENLIKHTLPSGLLHLSTIECGGRVASWHFGFVHNNRFYWYVPAYSKDFSRFSPGLLHIARLIEECYRLGVTTFDFLRGDERYKYEWTSDQVRLCSLEIPGSSPGSGAKSLARSLLRGAAGLLRR